MKVLGGAKYFKYNECNEGDVLIEKGRYQETIQGKFGVVHFFEELDTRERVGLNSSGSLNKKVDRLVEGDVVKIVYEGLAEIKKGVYAGKEAHQFQVMVYEESDLVDEKPAAKMVNKAPENKAVAKTPATKKSAVKKSSPLDDLE